MLDLVSVSRTQLTDIAMSVRTLSYHGYPVPESGVNHDFQSVDMAWDSLEFEELEPHALTPGRFPLALEDDIPPGFAEQLDRGSETTMKFTSGGHKLQLDPQCWTQMALSHDYWTCAIGYGPR